MTVAHEGRPGWGWQTGEWVRTPCFLRSRGHAPSLPSCSSAMCGGPAGAAVRKKGLSEYSRTAPTRGWQGKLQADAYEDLGHPGLQDKYCPFVSAYCRDQQTDELKIIIIIILIIYIPKGGNQIHDTCVCSP